MDLDFQTNHVKCKAKDIIMIQTSDIRLEADAIASKSIISEIILMKKLNKDHIIRSLQMDKISSAFESTGWKRSQWRES